MAKKPSSPPPTPSLTEQLDLSALSPEVLAAIARGDATREQQGMAMRALTTGLAFHVVGALERMNVELDNMRELKNRLQGEYYKRLGGEVSRLSSDSLKVHIEGIHKRELDLAEAYRRVAQSSGELFAQTAYSEEERKVMALFKAFTSDQQRERFMQLVVEELAKIKGEK